MSNFVVVLASAFFGYEAGSVGVSWRVFERLKGGHFSKA